jgi:hypothetical protein
MLKIGSGMQNLKVPILKCMVQMYMLVYGLYENVAQKVIAT